MNIAKILILFLLLGSLTFAASTILVLDASGSMTTTVTGTTKTRLEVAKEAANTVLNGVKSGDEVALIVFYDCSDIVTEVAFTTNMQTIKTKLATVQADGSTPIARAINYSAKYAQTSGRPSASIVLLTDGEETCDSQTTAVNAATNAVNYQGIKIVNVVGLGIQNGSSSETKLKQIATAGKGNYYSAQDANQLTSSLAQAYQSGVGSSLPSCCGSIALIAILSSAAFVYYRKN